MCDVLSKKKAVYKLVHSNTILEAKSVIMCRLPDEKYMYQNDECLSPGGGL